MEKVSNWGMYPTIEAEVLKSDRHQAIAKFINQHNNLIARGNGRCYGDSSLHKNIVSTVSLNKILNFDAQAGTIHCEAGVMLDDLLSVIVPKGFFLPVTPGTKFITLGGAIASNIHGKNHHKEGAIGEHTLSFNMIDESGEIIKCSRNENSEQFKNTIGGMGLTGVILSVEIRLKPIETSFINQKSIKAKNLDEIMELFEAYQHYTYSVAWIDCLSKGNKLGRSILMLGEHSKIEDLGKRELKNPLELHPTKQVNVPFNLPTFTLNKLTVSSFNTLFYGKQFKKEQTGVIHYNPYFYPLDMLKNWNRLYGGNGFTQYQFVIPFERGKEGMRKILTEITNFGEASFLAVLKTFGKKDEFSSPISFPEPGYTLALDFKVNPKVFALLDRLDKIVVEYGGKIYLAKDVRMSEKTMSATYPAHFSHSEKFKSLQSERLGI